MFWRLLLLEKDKVAGRLLLWIELGLLALAIVFVDMLEYIFADQTTIQQSLEWPHSAINAVSFAEAHSLGGILLVILIAVVTAREYSWRTFHLWLSRGVSRVALMGAKSVAVIGISLVLVLTSLIVGVVLTGILTFSLHGSLQLSLHDLQQLVLNFLATDLVLLPYATLTLLLTILFRNSAVSIGIGLVLLLLVESALYLTFSLWNPTTEQIAKYLPIGLSGSLQNAILGGPVDSHFVTPLTACICLFAYTIIFAALGTWRFTRQNFTD